MKPAEEQDSFDRITELLARDVDAALMDANLKLSPEERLLSSRHDAVHRRGKERSCSRHSCRSSSTRWSEEAPRLSGGEGATYSRNQLKLYVMVVPTDSPPCVAGLNLNFRIAAADASSSP